MGYIQLNKAAFFHNLEHYFFKIGGAQNLFAVLKDNAYGHGVKQIATLCCEKRVQNVCVRDLKEAQAVENLFKQILIFYHRAPFFHKRFTFGINGFEHLKNCQTNTKVWLKFDTGMHRNGFFAHEMAAVLEMALKKNLQIMGVFSHLSDAERQDKNGNMYPKNAQQKIAFLEIERFFKSHNPKIKSALCNSWGVENLSLIGDMARVGIGLYGYGQNTKPVASLVAKKIDSRILEAGEKVGYNEYFVCPNKMIVSVYDVGYADGFLRFNAQNINCYTTVEGQKILGQVNMDYISVEGDLEEVVLFRDAQVLAILRETNVYEVLTVLNERLRRVVV